MLFSFFISCVPRNVLWGPPLSVFRLQQYLGFMSENMLYLVSTPIGHLDDLSSRALTILIQCSFIIAEDTNRTQKLLSHYDVSTPTTSYHEDSSAQKRKQLIKRIQSENPAAYVSDAGNPAIQDPAPGLVKDAVQHDITVRVVPGPSAVTTALASSGFKARQFTFSGYPPRADDTRLQWLKSRCKSSEILVLFESPHRLKDTLQTLRNNQPNLPLVLCKELTKTHETIYRGTAQEVYREIANQQVRGEYTMVLDTRQVNSSSSDQTGPSLSDSLKLIEGIDLPPSQKAKLLAHFTDLTRSDAYDKLLQFTTD